MEYFLALTTESNPQTMQPNNPGAINGGMFKKDSTSSKQPLLVVDVESIDEHVKKLKKSRGKTIIANCNRLI